ncbi:MAG TPA: PASTA domain-containing protein [Clostridiales bacterium]|nr:PASTA domain-containing protein [Clostridiales bacterium]
MGNSSIRSKQRIVFLCAVVCLLVAALAFRVGWIQVVDRERYAALAIQQQTTDTLIPASRGQIVDRNGEQLAVSAAAFTIWVRPADVASGKTDGQKKKNLKRTVNTLAKILEQSPEEIRQVVTSEKNLLRVAKFVDKSKADRIRKAKLPGVTITETTRRFYPQGALAGYVLGGTTDDNRGLTGLELRYDKYLSGVPGRWIKNKDVNQNSLSYGIQKYFQAEDGLTVQLTIDEVIQHYVEKEIAAVRERTKAKRVFCLMMDPKTGEILALAVTPGFDPNDPRTPLDPALAEELKKLPDEQKMDFWNKLWRNPVVSDTYEPGSTFKLITTAMALEERKTTPTEVFYDKGYIMVSGVKLSCWRAERPHGSETLTKAVENSCNPVFVQLAQRLGIETYYSYLEKFGLMEKTGIDYPGEGKNLLQKQATAGPIGLATMSYGQGISVTPVSLLTAISAIGNKGMLMEPRLVKGLLDASGKTVLEFEPRPVRQVISEQTAAEMCLIMESVVTEGGGSKAQVPGYRVGGKTGTAEKLIGGRYTNQTDSSFIGMVPMDDPQIAILLVVDSPQGEKSGSQTAAPGVGRILDETLRYLHIKPDPSVANQKAAKDIVKVPDVVGRDYKEAVKILAAPGLKAQVSPTRTDKSNFKVIDQFPKPGEKVPVGMQVVLYWQ